MDFNEACLNLQLNDPFSLSELKKQYRMMSLKNHPDKHMPDIDGLYDKKFKTINESYVYLSTYLEESDGLPLEDDSYSSLFNEFLSSFFSNNQEEVYNVVQTIVEGCHDLSVKLFENMNKDKAIQIFEFINTYQHVLYISSETIDKIKNIINDKIENDNVVLLNPSLDDLIHDNIYMLLFEGQKYYVPLWHAELYYKHNTSDLVVKCLPELPDNISLDANNNLIINVSYSIEYLLNNDIVYYTLGKEIVSIPTRGLYIRKIQKYTVLHRGISVIDHMNIYNNNVKSDLIFVITIAGY